MSGIIAAEDNGYGITGIAPEARVVMVNAYNNTDGGFADSDIASAISYIVRECPDVSVVNMSLGGYTGEQEPALQAIIEYAISKNLLCIVAAGNEGAYNNRYGNGQTALPAGFEGVVSVASYNKNDELVLPVAGDAGIKRDALGAAGPVADVHLVMDKRLPVNQLRSDEEPVVLQAQTVALREPDVAVDSSSGIPSGAVFRIVDVDCDDVVALMQCVRQVCLERGITVWPAAHFLSVDPYSGE